MKTLAAKSLFEPALSKRNDPQTSYDAADNLVKSGALNKQEQLVLMAINDHLYYRADKTFTARELADATNIDYFLIQRRLSGLNNKCKIERISVNNNGQPPWVKRDGCCVWRIK